MRTAVLLSACLAAAVCVDVRIDDAAYLDCLNETFRAMAKSATTTLPRANPAAIPAPAAGTYNQAATREMLGRSFGHSIIPQRPIQQYPRPFSR